MADETVTVTLSSDAQQKLERLADLAKESPARLASQAITDFVETEIAVIEGIERGLADVEAGRVVPHDAAMRRIRQVIARVKSER
jgi:predicted transcriptional regulator